MSTKVKPVIVMADSCAGGLSVLKHFQGWAGNFEIIYLADYEKNPFGLKNKTDIIEIVRSWFENLIKFKNVKLVVIACNTASIASYDVLKELSEEYAVPIVSMVDGVIHSMQKNKKYIYQKNVAIMATKYTINSGMYCDIVTKFKPLQVFTIVATQSEHVVATGGCNSKTGRSFIKGELIKYQDANINTLLLACTCFQLITDQIKEILGSNIVCIDPAFYVSELSRKVLGIAEKIQTPKVQIFSTLHSPESTLGIHVSSETLLHKNLTIQNITLNR